MNKNKIISLTCIVVFFSILVSLGRSYGNRFKPRKTEYHSDATYSVSMNSLNDILKYADNIDYGKVVAEDEYSKFVSRYTIEVEKNIKGVTNSLIDVYEDKEKLDVYEEYLFFLEFYDSTLYPGPVYTSINKECLFHVVDGKIAANEFLNKECGLENLVNNLEKSSEFKNMISKYYKVKQKTSDIAELSNYADYIVHVKIEKTEKVNAFVNNTKLTVLEQFKGNIDSERNYPLPLNIEEGKEYLLFLKNSGDSAITVATRKDSVICKEYSKLWGEAMKSIRNQK